MISNSQNFDQKLHYFEITLGNLCQKFTFFVRIKPIWQLFQAPAYYEMTDIPRYGVRERAKITNFLVENCPTLQDYFKTMQPLIKVLTIRDHLESQYLSPI